MLYFMEISIVFYQNEIIFLFGLETKSVQRIYLYATQLFLLLFYHDINNSMLHAYY